MKAADEDAIIAAIDNAPLDADALTAEEAAALDAQIAEGRERMTRGEQPFRTSDEVAAEIAERAKRAG